MLPDPVLAAANPATAVPTLDQDADPLLPRFLQFLEQQISQAPTLIEPADPAQLARIATLIEGVQTDN
jgi:hypothetical protein